jgi:hypothetical protein
MTAPWEITANQAPWITETYQRVVTITRLNTVAGAADDQIGNVGYSGAQLDSSSNGYATLYSGIPADIQSKSAGRTKNTNLPADIIDKPIWQIFIPGSAVPQYGIRDRDVITDDENYRYQVGAAFWTTFGYQLYSVRLEA